MQARRGFNPYQLGDLGPSDSHDSARPYAANRYRSLTPNTSVSNVFTCPNIEYERRSWQDF